MRRRRPQRVRPESSGALMSPPRALSRSGVRLIALVLVVISLWLLVNFIGQVVVAARMDRQIADKQAEITEIEAANAALKDHVAYAESPAYAEQIAREQLGYAREGDTVILPTLPDRLTAPAAAPAPLPPPAHEPNWRGWLHAFFPPNTTP
jgi:cell division protein FtsB